MGGACSREKALAHSIVLVVPPLGHLSCPLTPLFLPLPTHIALQDAEQLCRGSLLHPEAAHLLQAAQLQILVSAAGRPLPPPPLPNTDSSECNRQAPAPPPLPNTDSSECNRQASAPPPLPTTDSSECNRQAPAPSTPAQYIFDLHVVGGFYCRACVCGGGLVVMNVYVHACVFVHMRRTCILSLYLHLCLCASVPVPVSVFLTVHVCLCVSVCLCLCVYVHVHTCVCVCVRACMHVCMCVWWGGALY